MSDEAYLAGLFDGEGCVVTFRHGRCYHVRPQIVMTNPRGLVVAAQLFGGKVSQLPQRDRHRLQWRWAVYSRAQAVAFFSAILPFSKVKRDEIVLALELLELVRPTRGAWRITDEEASKRDDLTTRIRLLKKAV
jgi:hypothetical protein